MKTTTTILLGAVAAAAFAGYAVAQPYGFGRPRVENAEVRFDISQRIHWIRDRIERGAADGSLDRREFKRVSRELDSIKQEEVGDRASNGGHLDPATRANLEQRLDSLNEQIQWIRRHDDRRPW